MTFPFSLAGIALAVAGVVLAPAASAQTTICDALSGAEPLSPYAQKVLDRADQGLANAESGTGEGNPSIFGLAENAGTAVLAGMDSQRRITDAVRNFTERSACLRYDSLLISCKIEEVREKLNDEIANEDRSSDTLLMLQELILFLFDRERHLEAGATDPWYADPDWGRVYAFDPTGSGFCCQTGDDGLSCEQGEYADCLPGTYWKTEDDCEQECGVTSFPEEDPRICPYYSDYAMPTEGQYGCDETVMPSAETFGDEKDALTELRAAVEQLRQQASSNAQSFDSSSLSSLAGASNALPRPPALSGCASDFGYCSDETALTCASSSDCLSGSCLFQKGTCLNSPTTRCTKDAECSDVGSQSSDDEGLASVCLLPPTSPPASVIRRGPFSLVPDQFRLLSDFAAWNARVGANRPFSSTFTETREDETNADEEAFVDPVVYLVTEADRSNFRAIGASLAADQARYIPLVETSDRLQQMLLPLRQATTKFSLLASAKNGLRKFVREFASFLHRTCLTDPCQTDLERVWTIANTDECFPYANGEYLEDDCTEAAQSRAKKCADEAGISIEVQSCPSSSSSGTS